MNWTSWTDFLAMGGYAPYVWGAVGVLPLALAAELLTLALQRRAILAELRQLHGRGRQP